MHDYQIRSVEPGAPLPERPEAVVMLCETALQPTAEEQPHLARARAMAREAGHPFFVLEVNPDAITYFPADDVDVLGALLERLVDEGQWLYLVRGRVSPAVARVLGDHLDRLQLVRAPGSSLVH